MSFNEITFNKENLYIYLRELAKEFRKLNGKVMPAEIILIGGAAVLANYGFRDMTYDMDAIIIASSFMKDAINRVGDKFNLPNGWLNTDFMKTKSYSPRLIEYSVPYKTFSNILSVRTISAEYLIAMKLMAGRPYKNDFSDIIGILMQHKENENVLTLEQIKIAVEKLYEKWTQLPKTSIEFIEQIMQKENYVEVYEKMKGQEAENKIVLRNFETNYPGVLSENNLNDVLKKAKEKLNR